MEAGECGVEKITCSRTHWSSQRYLGSLFLLVVRDGRARGWTGWVLQTRLKDLASRCARSMLGPSGVVKICTSRYGSDESAGDTCSVAVCDGNGLMRELNVAHPAATLLKEAVNGQQVYIRIVNPTMYNPLNVRFACATTLM